MAEYISNLNIKYMVIINHYLIQCFMNIDYLRNSLVFDEWDKWASNSRELKHLNF